MKRLVGLLISRLAEKVICKCLEESIKVSLSQNLQDFLLLFVRRDGKLISVFGSWTVGREKHDSEDAILGFSKF